MRGEPLEIEYKNKHIEKICTDAAAARAKYGEQMAAKIHMRVDNLRAATAKQPHRPLSHVAT